ncbi:MAG: hypothetical protein ACREGJ_03620 [Candidatus Saccharimonadales bacterium]
MQIVAISSLEDAHLPFVQNHLDKPLIVIDPISIRGITSHEITKARSGVVFDGKMLQDVTGVWYRKPKIIRTEVLPVDDSLQDYCRSALEHFSHLMRVEFEDALWVSDFYAIERAKNKTLQLRIARKLGFNVPDTLMTSSPEDAQRFIQNHRQCLVKSLATEFYKDSNKDYFFFAQKIKNKKELDYSGLQLAPAIFQTAIDANFDVRVTVVGNKVFAAAITGSAIDEAGSVVRDWRIGHFKGDMKIEALALPKRVAALCVAHVKELGLSFGAIDLVVDKKGKFWFLENNPNGQWAFVEEETRQPIGKAIAELLASGSKAT